MPSGPHPLRHVIIGGGASVFNMHRPALNLETVQVVGLMDIREQPASQRAAELGCAFYNDYQQMLKETRPDVAVIMTPHPAHPSIAIDCLRAGVHVLCEKPMAVTVGEADQMIAAAEASGQILAINFQQRFRPAIERAKALIDEGAIGPLVRVLSVEPWLRTAAYYRTADWRGKWETEGGGVLMNQAPHTQDLLCYLAGMPRKVWGWTRTWVHSIECEDTAQAMLEYPNGAPGYLTVSTVEYGEPRLEITGERGAIALIGNQLTVKRFRPPLGEFIATSPEMFGKPQVESETSDLPDTSGGHVAVYKDLHAAIFEGRQPRANGRQGLMSVELANAITLSSYQERAVTPPVDRAAYADLLSKLRARSRKQ